MRFLGAGNLVNVEGTAVETFEADGPPVLPPPDFELAVTRGIGSKISFGLSLAQKCIKTLQAAGYIVDD
jgi:hypothetical protein